MSDNQNNTAANNGNGIGHNSGDLPPVTALTTGVGTVMNSFAPKMAQARLTLAWGLQCIAALILFMAKHGGTVPATVNRKGGKSENISAVVTLDHLTAIDTGVWTKEAPKAGTPAAKAKAALVGFVAKAAEVEDQTATKVVEYAARLHVLNYTVEDDFNGHVSIDNGECVLSEHDMDPRFANKDMAGARPWDAPGFWRIRPEHVHPAVDNAPAVNPELLVVERGLVDGKPADILVKAAVQRVALIDRFFMMESGQDGYRKRDGYRVGMNTFTTVTSAILTAKAAADKVAADNAAEAARLAALPPGTDATTATTTPATATTAPTPAGTTPATADTATTTPATPAAPLPGAPVTTPGSPVPVAATTPAATAPATTTASDSNRTPQARTDNNVQTERDPKAPPTLAECMATITATMVPMRLDSPSLKAQALATHLHLTKTLRALGFVDYLKDPTDATAKRVTAALNATPAPKARGSK